jgi:hypothetical protein
MEVFGIIISSSVLYGLLRLGYSAYQSMARAAEERQTQKRMSSQ